MRVCPPPELEGEQYKWKEMLSESEYVIQQVQCDQKAKVDVAVQ
jgi:hypothetical protein